MIIPSSSSASASASASSPSPSSHLRRAEVVAPPQATNAIPDIENEAELPTDTVQDDTPLPEQPQTSPKSNYLLWLGVGVLLCLGALVLFAQRKKQKNL